MQIGKQKITPFLWFNDQAEEAARFYTSIFNNSEVLNISRYGEEGAAASGRPKGSVMTVAFRLEGQEFVALNGGPYFKFSEAISFVINCESQDEVDRYWEKLSEGGDLKAQQCGWLKDRFGLSWQVMAMGAREIRQKITPTLMYAGPVAGRAEEAVRRYASLFESSTVGEIDRYGEGEEPDRAGTVRHAGFTLAGQSFAAMDSARVHGYSFTEAVSFMIECGTQAEIDRFWDGLSQGGDPAAQQCGWLKDRYGVSWQVVPAVLDKMMRDPDPAKVARVMTAFFQMKKFDIAGLQKAYDGR